jgi:mannose-1-phosphate guanylyltransferase
MKAVILAGGSGERFWPLSTPDQPKQFLRLFGDRSLIRTTYDRLKLRFDDQDIFVITSKEHRDMTLQELPEIPERNIIGEPKRMNTAAACMVGTLMAEPDELVLTVPADHLIPDEEDFWRDIDRGVKCINEIDGLFTFGIRPTRPDTGFGYIEMGSEVSSGIFEVKRFKEKPDENTAREYVDSGNFLWNSGMFLWRRSTFLKEMESRSPSVYGPLSSIDPSKMEDLVESYEKVQRISIDHSLMEVSEKVMVVPSKFNWSDVGNWLSIKEMEGSKDIDNVSLVESENIFIKTRNERKLAVIGLKDLIIVETDEGLLICSDHSTQKVRDASRKFNKIQ